MRAQGRSYRAIHEQFNPHAVQKMHKERKVWKHDNRNKEFKEEEHGRGHGKGRGEKDWDDKY
jgi:hypothetical protein